MVEETPKIHTGEPDHKTRLFYEFGKEGWVNISIKSYEVDDMEFFHKIREELNKIKILKEKK